MMTSGRSRPVSGFVVAPVPPVTGESGSPQAKQCVASAGLIAPHAWQYIEVEKLAFKLLAISAPSHLHCRRQYIVHPVTTSRTSPDRNGRDTSESRPVKPLLDCWPGL